MEVVADLEVHSKYARAVSPQMVLPIIAEWAEKKGINLVGTGDFTHPLWIRELEAGLEEAEEGLYKPKDVKSELRFLLTSEISCIYTHNDKGRRVHLMVYLPSFSTVNEFNSELTKRGANLLSDGRPMMSLTLAQVTEIALLVEPKAIIIPAHVWTPWYGFYGHKSGYDHLEEAFGELTKHIHAVETGLSSDPAMNWKIDELNERQIVSFSDAHSPHKLGREATVFNLESLSYDGIRRAIMGKGNDEIAYTIEFYPEEGKYHYTGHRKCDVIFSPKQARKRGIICPVCGKPLTIGVMNRVESLAKQGVEIEATEDEYGARWIRDKGRVRKPYVMLVPLLEIIAEAISIGVGTKAVMAIYDQLINAFKSEFDVLLRVSVAEIEKVVEPRVAEGIVKVRSGDIAIKPGYDGVFGKVSIWKEGEVEEVAVDQATLF